MSIGARDRIDQLLVKKYAKESVNNASDAEKLHMSNDRYWEVMRDVAQVHQTLVKVATFAQNGLGKAGLQSAKSQA